MAAAPLTGNPHAVPLAAPIGRLVSSDSIPAGGFTPGMVLSGRYRIIGLIGRGGMGEVYRADDLKLGQPVALKFLPRTLAEDPVRRERLYAEVRIARQVSHPNICRVYDIGDIEGQHFLTMEFIDGEDLASLLQRIGHLHGTKALDIARQLCAGLAAAHDKGVLHRDLKPANVMIDGRGRVRITDFGLAVAAAEEIPDGDVSGTPAYMAPEQFAGKGSSVRSDINALGLVFYELYTGRRAFVAKTVAELREKKESGAPTAPSEITRDIDPIVERVILRCLEKDPRQRPASAAQVAAALPGGNPLAAALAAGETPSPEMVAASVQTEGLRPAVAWALLGAAILGMFLTIPLASRASILRRFPLTKPPEILAERAREILQKIGYNDPAADSAFGIMPDDDYLRYVREHDRSANRFDSLPDSAICFWYRQSPSALRHVNPISIFHITSFDPPMTFSGEALLFLDRTGRLISLKVVPPEREASPGLATSPDWPAVFREAGLDPAIWTAAQPEWMPLYYADSRSAWTGSMPERPKDPMRIEAAALHGKPVSFNLIAPWTRPTRMTETKGTRSEMVGNIFGVVILAVLMGGGLFFAHRNLRLGRGDRRGAWRLALFVMIMNGIAWLTGEKHVADIWELYLLMTSLAWAVFISGLVWVLYLALEPFVRRKWPGSIVSWSRLLAGEVKDPLVGRDLLIGCVFGAFWVLLQHSIRLAPEWLGQVSEIPVSTDSLAWLETRQVVSTFAYNLVMTPLLGLAVLFLLFFLRLVLRDGRLAGAGFVLLMGMGSIASFDNWWVIMVFTVAHGLLVLYFATRFGLVTIVTGMACFYLLADFPITLQFSEWYAGQGLVGLLSVASLAVFAFYTSLGGRPLFGSASLGDQ